MEVRGWIGVVDVTRGANATGFPWGRCSGSRRMVVGT